MSKRFRRSVAERMMSEVLRRDPTAMLVAPSRLLNGGCSDPEHCPQHPGTFRGEPMVEFKTTLSGQELHRIRVGEHEVLPEKHQRTGADLESGFDCLG